MYKRPQSARIIRTDRSRILRSTSRETRTKLTNGYTYLSQSLLIYLEL